MLLAALSFPVEEVPARAMSQKKTQHENDKCLVLINVSHLIWAFLYQI
jgi:hypothetical protein